EFLMFMNARTQRARVKVTCQFSCGSQNSFSQSIERKPKLLYRRPVLFGQLFFLPFGKRFVGSLEFPSRPPTHSLSRYYLSRSADRSESIILREFELVALIDNYSRIFQLGSKILVSGLKCGCLLFPCAVFRFHIK